VKLPVTPNFKKAGKVSVVLDVEGIGAMSTSGDSTMDMKKMPILSKRSAETLQIVCAQTWEHR
jgi:hypothetical protein